MLIWVQKSPMHPINLNANVSFSMSSMLYHSIGIPQASLSNRKMASTVVPNMSFYAHTSSGRMNKFSNVKLLPVSSTRNRTFCNNVKAMAGGEASLQKSNQHQQQVQPKMKVPQGSPKVLLSQFPVARTVQQMMDTMERMGEDPLVYGRTSPLIVAGDDEYSKGKIPWAIKEGQKDYKMRFNMPGMNKNDVKVWVEENMLVVKAEKAQEENHEGRANGNEDWPANSYGRYNHRIALPENIEFDKIKAQVKDGILYVTIPKASTSAKIIGIDVQ